MRSEDEKKFEDMLTESQNVVVEGGFVLKRAVYEPNMLSASSLYSNISLDELGTLLGTSAARAEAIACKMIEEGRMKATIDQIDSFIDFENGKEQNFFSIVKLIAMLRFVSSIHLGFSDSRALSLNQRHHRHLESSSNETTKKRNPFVTRTSALYM